MGKRSFNEIKKQKRGIAEMMRAAMERGLRVWSCDATDGTLTFEFKAYVDGYDRARNLTVEIVEHGDGVMITDKDDDIGVPFHHLSDVAYKDLCDILFTPYLEKNEEGGIDIHIEDTASIYPESEEVDLKVVRTKKDLLMQAIEEGALGGIPRDEMLTMVAAAYLKGEALGMQHCVGASQGIMRLIDEERERFLREQGCY